MWSKGEIRGGENGRLEVENIARPRISRPSAMGLFYVSIHVMPYRLDFTGFVVLVRVGNTQFYMHFCSIEFIFRVQIARIVKVSEFFVLFSYSFLGEVLRIFFLFDSEIDLSAISLVPIYMC